MRTLFPVTVLKIACFAWLPACSHDATGDSSGGSRVIHRVPVPESRFKPTALEATIDNLIVEVEAEGASKDIGVGVVLKDLFEFWRPVAVGSNRALSELVVPGTVQGVTDRDIPIDDVPMAQMELIDAQYELGYHGLALAPLNDLLGEKVDQWVDEGKTVVTIDGDLPHTKRHLYIGTDNARAGITAAETLLALLEDPSGRIIVLGNDNVDWDAGYTRTYAAANALSDAGYEVQVVNSAWDTDGTDARNVLAAIEDPTQAAPVVGILGVFANAYSGADAAVAAELTTLPVIVGFDFLPETLDYMAQGVIAATHAQRQYYMGYLSVYATYAIEVLGLERTKAALANHLVRGNQVDTGLDVIHADELEQWTVFVSELGID